MAVAATTAGYFSTAHANQIFEDSFVDPAAAALESSLHGPATPEQIYDVLGSAWFDTLQTDTVRGCSDALFDAVQRLKHA